jgi:hypothetical protein
MADSDIVFTRTSSIVKTEAYLIQQAIEMAGISPARGVRIRRGESGKLVSIELTTEVEAFKVEEYPYS